GRLGVDGCAEVLTGVQPAQLLHHADVAVGERRRVGLGGVAPAAAGPGVADHRQGEAAVLAEHVGAGAGGLAGVAGARIDVEVLHVAVAAVDRAAAVDPAHVVDQAGRVPALDQVGDAGLVVLAPALVERHPHDDRRAAAVLVDHGLQLGLELRLVTSPGRGRHVLPDEQAELVGVVVPAVGLDLDVLADRVEAEPLGLHQVVLESLVGGRGVDAVGPEALVERADLEDGLAVEQHPVVLDFDAAHAEVRADLVALHPDGQVVQVRVLRRPEPRVAHGHGQLGADAAGDAADDALAVADGHDRVPAAAVHGDLDSLVRHVGDGVDPLDVVPPGHRLHPDGLPDAG